MQCCATAGFDQYVAKRSTVPKTPRQRFVLRFWRRCENWVGADSRVSAQNKPPNPALHRTDIPLRSITAGELC